LLQLCRIRKEETRVAKFIAVHSMPKNILEQLMKTPKEQLGSDPYMINTMKHCDFDAYFVRSWVAPALGKVFCEWNAKDEKSIRKVLENYKGLPIDAITEMRIIESEDYRGK
jgi:hypothetical protein